MDAGFPFIHNFKWGDKLCLKYDISIKTNLTYLTYCLEEMAK